MSLKISTSVLAAGFVIASLAVSVGPSVAADQTAASHRVGSAHHRYPGRIAPGIYGYAPEYGPAPYRFGIGPGYTTNHDAWLSSGYW